VWIGSEMPGLDMWWNWIECDQVTRAMACPYPTAGFASQAPTLALGLSQGRTLGHWGRPQERDGWSIRDT